MSKVEVGVAPPTGAGMTLGVRMEAASVARALNESQFGEWVLVRDFNDLCVKKLKFVNEVKHNLKDKSLTVHTRSSELGLHFKLAAKRTRKNPAEKLKGAANTGFGGIISPDEWTRAVNDALLDVKNAGLEKVVGLESDYNMNASEQKSDEYDELDSDDPNWVDPDEHLYVKPEDLVVND